MEKVVKRLERHFNHNHHAQVEPQVSRTEVVMVPLSTILEAELEQTPDAPNHGTLTERLEDANKALVVPFAWVVRGTAATITGILTHVVVWFNDDEHSKFTANINEVMVDPDVMVWGPARKQRSQLSIARREGLKRSVARRKSKPKPGPGRPTSILP